MKRPLSIAIVRQRFVRDGGAERFVARMLEALKGEEISISLITRNWEQVPGVDVIKVNPFYIGRLWRDWSFARAVCKLLKTRKFDLVQSHERIACCDIYRAGDGVHREWLAQLARMRGPLARLFLVINPYHRYVKCAERKMFTSSRLRAVICNSKMVRDEIVHHFGLSPDKLHVIYSGVDTEQFNPNLRQHRAEVRKRQGIPDDAPLFLFVGSGFERKGVSQLLEAMATLTVNVRLLVIGRDRNMPVYVQQAARLGLENRVRFLGSMDDVKPYYGAADALVLPTLYDPFPNVVLEAMACGVFVITSRKCGAAEMLTNRSGDVCDALDVACLGASMQKISGGRQEVGTPETRMSLDYQRMAGELKNLYRHVQEQLSG